MAGDDDFDVVGRIVVDDDGTAAISSLNEGLDEIKTHADDASGESGGGGITALGVALGDALGNIAVQAIDKVVEGLQEMVGQIGEAVAAAAEEQDVTAIISATIDNLGAKTDETTASMVALAESIGQTTPVGHDAALAAEKIGLSYANLSKEVMPQYMAAVTDMAAGTGRSVQSISMIMARSLTDPESSLSTMRRYGVTLSDATKTQIKTLQDAGDLAGAQAVYMQAIEGQFGGDATAAAGTYDGQMAILNDTFEQLKETVGDAFLPILTNLVTTFHSLADNPAVKTFLDGVVTSINNLLGPAQDAINLFNQLINPPAAATTGKGPMHGALDFDPGPVKAKATGLVADLANIFTGLKTGGLAGAMPGLGGLFNDMVDQINKIDWKGLSDTLAAKINGIDWAKIGAVVSVGVTKLMGIVSKFIGSVDWGPLLGSIFTGIANLIVGFLIPGDNWQTNVVDVWSNDFKEIGGRWNDMWGGVHDALGTAWDNIGKFFGTHWAIFKATVALDWDTFKTDLEIFLHGIVTSAQGIVLDITNAGTNIIYGLLNGFKNAWGDVVKWVNDQVQWIVDTFHKAFNIHSPSGVFDEIGRNMMAGLAQGLNAGFSMPMTTINNMMPQLAGGGGNTIHGSTSVVFQISGGDPKAIAREIATTLKLQGIQNLV